MPLEDWLPSTPPGPPTCFVCSSTEHATMDHPQPSLEEAWLRLRKLPPPRMPDPAPVHPDEYAWLVQHFEYERRRRGR